MTELYRKGSLQEVEIGLPNDFLVVRFQYLKSTIWKNVRKYQREGIAFNLNNLVQIQIVNLVLKFFQ